MYTVRVKIEVIDEQGVVVDYQGYPASAGRTFHPSATSQKLKEYDNIKQAHHAMNLLFGAVQHIGALTNWE